MRSKGNPRASLCDLLERLERSCTLALDDFIEGQLRLIEERYQDLGNPGVRAASRDELTLVACRLGHLYSAFESLFRRVSRDFLRLSPPTRLPILERMRMDLSPTRPAVIDSETFEKLNALARFRHWFFLAEHDLQEADVAPVLRKALELRAVYRPQIEAFLEFLRRVR
jgi:hypothetical protein